MINIFLYISFMAAIDSVTNISFFYLPHAMIGDGNFSFSLSLIRSLGTEAITATSFQSDFEAQPTTQQNIDSLRELGAHVRYVRLGVGVYIYIYIYAHGHAGGV